MARTGIQYIGKGLAERYRKLARQLPEQVDAALYELAEEAQADFEKTTATWNNPPQFRIVERARSVTVATDDDRYRFVDKGTRPHLIRPKNKPFLAFQAGYRAKTSPRIIASRPGGKSGPTVFTQKPVHHPGTKARKFSVIIFAKYQEKVGPRVRQTLKAGVEAVGL